MRQKRLFVLFLAFSVVAIYLLFREEFDSNLFFEAITSVHPIWLLASICMAFGCYLIRALRWQILLISIGLIKLSSLFWATILGFSVIYLLGRVGEVARPIWIARREGIPVTSSFATITVERVFDILMLIALFVSIASISEIETAAPKALDLLTTSVWSLLAISSVVLLTFVLFRKHVSSILKWLPIRKASTILERFADGLAVTGNWQNLGLTTAYSFLLWVGIALQFWMMLLGLNLGLTFAEATLVLVSSALGSIVQVPGIGGGFQAAFVFCVTTFFLVPLETAVAASLLAWFFTCIPTIAVAAIYMAWQGISSKELITSSTANELH